MKKYSFLLLLPFFGFAQTPAERQKIVSTYDQVKIQQLKADAAIYMAEQKKLIAEYKAKNNVVESEKHSLQRIFDGIPHYFTIFNDGSSKTIRANSMYPNQSLGLSVTGAGLTAGVWDGGKVRNTHVELNSKVILNDGASELSAHATHVTGTIVASGNSITRRGIAYGADALTYDWDTDYEEMIDFGLGGYLVSNHSYGYQTDNLPTWKFGQYDSSSVEVDNVSNTYPYYQVVIAAGNDRNSGIEQDFNEMGYDLISGTSCSKNGITVAAVNELLNYTDPTSVLMSDFSNFGPPDDGRIKPDIAAKGVAVSSCISTTNIAYADFNGTSMAAPAVSGLILLLQNHYSDLNGSYMRASTVRGLLCHSAREAGFYEGPDYEFGWGLADGLTAANIITNNGSTSIIEENLLPANGTFTKQITVTNPQMIQASICWTDPSGAPNNTGANDNRTPRLRNNLDIKVTKDSEVYYPYSLNVEDPFSPATREGVNNVDNMERVDVDFANPGVYTITVTHSGNLQFGNPQAFSLIVSGTEGLNLSVDSSDFADNIVVYPNPVVNTLNFSVPQNAQVSNVSMFDILGKEVGSRTQPLNNSIDVSALSTGVYMVKFMVDGKPVVRKFVKK